MIQLATDEVSTLIHEITHFLTDPKMSLEAGKREKVFLALYDRGGPKIRELHQGLVIEKDGLINLYSGRTYEREGKIIRGREYSTVASEGLYAAPLAGRFDEWKAGYELWQLGDLYATDRKLLKAIAEMWAE